ncbi:hypothetical protein HanXRQr2_Chr17g0799601 [Helianthus annuus]|uniref:Uncharacterized protein n=1 Tax=Helianthus annuus TaxID=4232 RepID=A0A9K3DJ52_HELAN|nr:hypothetical protein HanXRQr2_Chr17g0799601 [Helianthus annuus]KAJ0812898.1 hypothetical protein HanPSC8_Chr17g0767191 [Helianthus annuus]
MGACSRFALEALLKAFGTKTLRSASRFFKPSMGVHVLHSEPVRLSTAVVTPANTKRKKSCSIYN